MLNKNKERFQSVTRPTQLPLKPVNLAVLSNSQYSNAALLKPTAFHKYPLVWLKYKQVVATLMSSLSEATWPASVSLKKSLDHPTPKDFSRVSKESQTGKVHSPKATSATANRSRHWAHSSKRKKVNRVPCLQVEIQGNMWSKLPKAAKPLLLQNKQRSILVYIWGQREVWLRRYKHMRMIWLWRNI